MKQKKLIWKLQENILDENNKKELANFIEITDRFTQFEKVREFEKQWSKWQGCAYSVFVNSGSSANMIILDSLRELYHWNSGDEIIVPAVTWATDISTTVQFGLNPVFVDINLTDFSFDYKNLEKKISKKTRAIFLTHLIGFPADIDQIRRIIGQRKILLIEDCCESHGARIKNKKVGNFGIANSFSFYWGHHMTSVEGGMICTNSEKMYKLALLKRSHGLARELPKKYHNYYKNLYKFIDFNFLFLTSGFNVRSTEFHAVLAMSQLKNLDQYISIRNHNHALFLKLLKKYEKYFLIPDNPGISSFCLPFFLKEAKYRKPLQLFLTKKGIESRPIIGGNLLKQPFLKRFKKNESFPFADFVHNNGFYVGNNQFVNSTRIKLLNNLLSEFFKSYE